jgi:ketosteroid isomerase-like protein
VPQASAVVRRFYEAYNTRDLDVIQSLIADDISYQ